MRTRLTALAVVPLLVLATACGSDDGGGGNGGGSDGGLDGVEITGDYGSAPEIAVEDLSVTEQTSVVLSTGDGPEADVDRQFLIHLALSKGTDGTSIASTWEVEQPLTIGPDAALIPELVDTLQAAVDGVPRGSRVAFTAPAEDTVGANGLAQFGLEEGDSVVGVADILSVQPDSPAEGPQGEETPAPKGSPGVQETDGNVTGFDWSDVGAKPGELEVITLIEGDGPAITAQRLVQFDYFGEVFKAKEPFDESYSAEPITFAVGANSLIDAWDEGLIGVKEGSRVMIITPPDKAYGAQGSPPSIPADATLVFVLDVLDVDG